jgi:hypothetical protein
MKVKMDLTIGKLIKILVKDKRLFVIFFIISILFYPIYYFSYNLINPRLILKVDTMYNYTIPNSISSFLSDTFVNHLRSNIENQEFLKKGYKCNVIINDNTKNKTLECSTKKENKDEQTKNFKTFIYEMYSKHIDHLYESITYAPQTFADTNIATKYNVVNNENLLFLKKEKDLKFYLNVETAENLKIFNFTHYILSFILIFFLNIFRIILKY